MKRKTCPTCNKQFKINQTQFRKIFCSLKCTQDMAKIQKLQMQVLEKEKEYTELETEVLYTKKQNLIMRESIGYDSPFTANYKDKIEYNLTD